MHPLFYDRKEAGRALAIELAQYEGREDTIVLGLARGGVVVAYEPAKALSLSLNVVVPRKIGAPGNSELAVGSIMENGEGVFNQSIINALGVSQSYIVAEIKKERALAQQRLTLYRQYTPLPTIKDHTVILVDDGIATGSTMLTAVKAMRQAGAESVIVAAPVSSNEAYLLLTEEADEVYCPYVMENFFGVGLYYQCFGQTDDQEVVRLLSHFRQEVNQHED